MPENNYLIAVRASGGIYIKTMLGIFPVYVGFWLHKYSLFHMYFNAQHYKFGILII